MSYYEPEIKVDVAAQELSSLAGREKHLIDPMDSGFLWYTPPLSSTASNSTGGQVWQISGHDMQVLSMSIPPNDTIITEVGSFMFGSADIKTNVELTCCSSKGCSEGWSRIFGGESCVKVLLLNDSTSDGYIGLTPNFPAKVIPIKFGTHISENRSLIAQKGAYMTELGDVNVACSLDCSPSTCCCAGFGLCRQKISGTRDSVAFLAAGGTLIYRQLERGETIIVDSRSVVAVEDSVTIGITPNGRLCTCLCGGEGCFSTTLTGPGKIFMQSLNFYKFQEQVQTTVMEERTNTSDPAAGSSQ